MRSGQTNRPEPAPRLPASARPFWQALAEGRLVAPRCRACGADFFPPRPVCPECLSTELEWRRLSGHGSLHSWTVVHRAAPPVATPFVLGLVDLADAPGRLVAAVDVPAAEAAERLAIGASVRVGVRSAGPGAVLYHLELVSGE